MDAIDRHFLLSQNLRFLKGGPSSTWRKTWWAAPWFQWMGSTHLDPL